MAKITIAMAKELRERTGSDTMEYKKALIVTGGDIEKTIDDMRATGVVKAAKKANDIAAEGPIAVKTVADNKAIVIIKVNPQTDSLVLQGDFKGSAAESLEKVFNEELTDATPLVKTCEEARLALVAKTGENVNIRRLARVEGDVVGTYLHGHRIGVVVNLKGGNPELAKDIAMYIAASSPQLLSASEVSEEATAKEKETLLALNVDKIADKSENIVENTVKGRISKFLVEASLIEQSFMKNPEMKIDDLAKQAGAEIVSFVRYKAGEGVKKAEVDFTAEVTAQVATTKQ